MAEAEGSAFVSVIKSIWKGIAFFFLEAKARRTLILVLLFLSIMWNPIKLSFQEHNARYAIDKFVSSLVSTDSGVQIEVTHALSLREENKLSTFSAIYSMLKIIGFIYAFWLYGRFFYWLFDKWDTTSGAKNFIFAIIVILLLQVSGSLYIIYQDHNGGLLDDTKYVLGEKSAWEMVGYLNPVKGFITLAKNIDVYLDPLARIGSYFS